MAQIDNRDMSEKIHPLFPADMKITFGMVKGACRELAAKLATTETLRRYLEGCSNAQAGRTVFATILESRIDSPFFVSGKISDIVLAQYLDDWRLVIQPLAELLHQDELRGLLQQSIVSVTHVPGSSCRITFEYHRPA
jgi:hypothetical protein